MNHVFISYSTKNADYAYRLAAQLRAENFDVWIDNRQLRPGDDWWRSIVLALRDCAAFVVILTPESDDSRWVQREITLAEKYTKPIFPVLLEGDLNSPNWEMFIRLQVQKVTDGQMPPSEFFDYVAQYAPRQDRHGTDVTDVELETVPVVDANDVELAQEIANPPPATEMMHLPLKEVVPQNPTSRTLQVPLKRTGLITTGVAIIVLVIVLVLLSNRPKTDELVLSTTLTHAAALTSATQTAEQTETLLAAALNPTDTPTFTPSATATVSHTPSKTPTATATLSGTEYELTVQSEIGLIGTENSMTQAAQQSATSEAATAIIQAIADSQTATASHWTQTPTPDARLTAEARLTQTQQAAIDQATQNAIASITQDVRNQTATADAWTDTPTATNTATLTYTPTATRTPTPIPPTPTRTPTRVPPTATRTSTRVPPTATRIPTRIPPTRTPSRTPTPTITHIPMLAGHEEITLGTSKSGKTSINSSISYSYRGGPEQPINITFDANCDLQLYSSGGKFQIQGDFKFFRTSYTYARNIVNFTLPIYGVYIITIESCMDDNQPFKLSVEKGSISVIARVTGSKRVNLHGSPTIDGGIAGGANSGEEVTIVGRSADGQWFDVRIYEVQINDQGSAGYYYKDGGWIAASKVSIIQGEVSSVPIFNDQI